MMKKGKSNALQRVLSFAMALIMVLSLLPVSALAAGSDTVTVYFQNNWLWTDVRIHYWGDGDTNWPGQSMTYVENDGTYDIYSAELPAGVTGMIFNGIKNDGSGNRDQSPDITSIQSGNVCYYMTWNNGNQVGTYSYTPPVTAYNVTFNGTNVTSDGAATAAVGEDYTAILTAAEDYTLPETITVTVGGETITDYTYADGVVTIPAAAITGDIVIAAEGVLSTITVYFQNNWLWTDVCIHYWGDGATNWPGQSMTYVENDGSYDIYSAKIPAGVTGMIFNGIKNDGSGNRDQSPDITSIQSGSVCYYMTWNNGNQVATFSYVPGSASEPTTEATEPEVPSTEYYLYGWLNGADVAANDYKFENGKLSLTLTAADNYVFVKDSTGASYMTDGWLGFETTSAVLSTSYSAGDKLYVPAGEYEFTLVENGDGTVTLSCVAAGSGETSAEYYLYGWFNGADVAANDYKFENGKLSLTLTAADNYVFVKDSTGASYMTDGWLGFETTSAVLSTSYSTGDKLYVPAGEYEFTLVENGDGTVTLSCAAAGSTPEIPEGYTAVTIHFLKTEGWGSTINGYVWTSGGAVPGYEDYNTWPGKSIGASAGHSGWYDLIVATENPTAFNFIFNDGGNQTADLYTGEITGDTELWVIGNAVMTTAPGEWTGDYDYTANIYFWKPVTWGDTVNAYLWDAGGALPGYEAYNVWPGAAIEADAVNEGWYVVSVTMDENAGFNFIFNDGSEQTHDLSTGTLDVTTNLWVVGDDVLTAAPEGFVDPNRKVYVPGTLPGPSWDASSNQMTYDPELGLYVYTFKDVPAANYEFKIAINGSWNENYGAGGVKDGYNIAVTVPQTMDVTVYYNDQTHYAVTNVNYVFADIILSGTGIESAKLEDKGLTGIYSVTVDMAAGTYSDVKLTYNGQDYTFAEIELKADKAVTFYMDPVTGIYYCDASNIPIDTAKIYFNSQDSAYKSEFGAIATGESCTFAIDTGTDITSAVLVIKGVASYPMTSVETDDGLRWSCVASINNIGEYDYYFAVSNGSAVAIYGDDDGYYGEGKVCSLTDVLPYDLVVYKSGYETPEWMKKAVIYQIFPDRFFDGDETNNQAQTTARGDIQYEYVSDWYLLPENPEQEQMNPDAYPDNAYVGDGEWSNEIYGGDLQGIIQKIDYLKALGVNVIYINPVFSSISNHRYDACDYTEIDPILGTMGDFEELVAIATENDMHIILDGVFNHVSDDSIYFDRYYKFLGTSEKIGAYPYWAYVYDYMAENGVAQADAEAAAKTYFSENYGITDYSYTEWFEVYNSPMSGAVDSIGLRAGKSVYSYDGWWGYDSMPIIYSTNGSEYQTGNWAEEIICNEDGTSVTQYWISKGSDGWRLDVANEVSDETWQKFRESVKAMNSDAVIIGEIWDDATKYLMGDMYDSVMNYMFRSAVTAFAKGTSAETTMKELEKLRERYPEEAFYAMMNLVGSHDTSRILSYLDGIDDDRNQKDPASAYPTYETTSDLAKNRQYLVAFLQFTYPGAPTIYYGDELGMVGSDDPDDRRAMEWGNGNQELVEWYATLAAIRAEYPALSTGSIKPIALDDTNLLGYIRGDETTALIVIGNNNQNGKTKTVTLDLNELHLDAESLTDLISGTEYTVVDGKITISIAALRGAILTKNAKEIKIDSAALAPAYDPAYSVADRAETAPNMNYTTQDGQTVELGDSLSFSVDALVNTFVEVKVDGETVDPADYDVTTGTVITLSAALIEELGLGEHSIEIVFEGGSATAAFTVVEEIEVPTQPSEDPTEESTEATEPAETPTESTTEETEGTTAATEPADDSNAQTGDSSNVVLWGMMLMLSAAAIVAMLFQNKKNKVAK